jgi:hypothetical protein
VAEGTFHGVVRRCQVMVVVGQRWVVGQVRTVKGA